MDFEEFFKKKRIDLAALGKAEPDLFSEFKTHFEQMGEKSFDHTKKYWFNKLRLLYHLAPEPKVEKFAIENPLAQQTITETLSETTSPSANVSFKPRFKPGMGRPEQKEEPAPSQAEDPAKTPNADNTLPPSIGFKPKFRPGVTKPAGETSDTKNPALNESATSTPEVNAAAETKDQNPLFEQEKEKMQQQADSMERTTDEETPLSEPSQDPPVNIGFKPRFKAGVTKPTTSEPKEEPKIEPPAEDKPEESAAPKPAIGFKPRFKMKPKDEE